MNLTSKILMLALAICISAGCATVPTSTTRNKPVQGIYHRVGKGQTLWSISKLYNVDLDELVRSNKLLNSSQIQAGQMLFIPRNEQLNPVLSSGEEFIWPIKGTVLSAFNQVSSNAVNKGVDIRANYGSFVGASRSGKVIFASENLRGFGKTIIVQHDDNFSTVYARNSENLVKVGETIKQGQLIAKVGSSGRNNVAYLHFEIRKKHIPQNPYYYLSQ